MTELLPYQLALVKLKGIGPVNTRKLVAECGGVKEVFSEKSKILEAIPGVPTSVSDKHERERALKEVESEIRFIEKQGLQTHFFLDATYPDRLKHCVDAPVLLFSKGKMDMNAKKSIGFIGTRAATQYGKEICEKLIADLKDYDPLIVSGLAVGIDITAHRAALANGLQTIACLGSGMDRVYPTHHQRTAKDMQAHGGIITEFWSGTGPDRENFPQRNRIVAGMIDVLIVVESTRTGGSMITSKLAFGYNREIMAVPGRMNDPMSEGTNLLIQRQQAGIITTAEDVVKYMGWDLATQKKTQVEQQKLYLDLSDKELKLVNLIRDGHRELDVMAAKAEIPVSEASATLLTLEFAGVVKSHPGKVYSVV